MPAFLALERPMAMACFLLVTFLPLPDLSVPSFLSFISVSTLLPAAGEYFRADNFLPAVFFFALLEFFFAAFLVAILYPPRESDVALVKAVVLFSRKVPMPLYVLPHVPACCSTTQRAAHPAGGPVDRPQSSMRCRRAYLSRKT